MGEYLHWIKQKLFGWCYFFHLPNIQLFKEWLKCPFSVKPFLILPVVIHYSSRWAPIRFVAPPIVPAYPHSHSLVGAYCVPAVVVYSGIALHDWGQTCAVMWASVVCVIPEEIRYHWVGHKSSVICLSEVIGVSPSSLDSSLCFIQSSISHDVLCM